MTNGTLIIVHDTKEGDLYITSYYSGSVVQTLMDMSSDRWHNRLGHMSMKEMQMMLEKGKISGLRSINLGSYKDCILEEQHNINFGIYEEPLRLQLLELIHIGVRDCSGTFSWWSIILCYLCG